MSARVAQPKNGKLPVKAALKIGCSSFRYRPIRFVVTVLLSVCAFAFLGVSLNIALNRYADVIYHAMERVGVEQSVVHAYYNNSVRIPVKEKVRAETARRLHAPVLGVVEYPLEIEMSGESDAVYDLCLPSGVAHADAAILNECGFSVAGKLPEKSNEIGLTQYTADVLNRLCYGKQSPRALIGQSLTVNNAVYRITAIIDTVFDEEAYAPLKNQSDTDSDLAERFVFEISTSVHNVLFVADLAPFIKSGIDFEPDACFLRISPSAPTVAIHGLAQATQEHSVYVLQESDDSCFLPSRMISLLLQQRRCDFEYRGKRYTDYGSLFRALYESQENTEEDRFIRTYQTYKDEYSFPADFSCDLTVQTWGITKTFAVSGFYTETEGKNALLCGGARYAEAYEKFGGEYDFLVVPRANKNIKQYIGKNLPLQLYNYATEKVYGYSGTIDAIKNVSAILAGVFSFFAVILLLNFLTQSVTDRMQTIGILKAIGCGNGDLIKIFVWEGLIIGGLVFVFSSVCSVIGYSILNHRFLALFVLRPPVFLLLLGAIALFSVIGCLIPVIRLFRLTPDKIIRQA